MWTNTISTKRGFTLTFSRGAVWCKPWLCRLCGREAFLCLLTQRRTVGAGIGSQVDVQPHTTSCRHHRTSVWCPIDSAPTHCVCRQEPKRHWQTRKTFTLCVVENVFFSEYFCVLHWKTQHGLCILIYWGCHWWKSQCHPCFFIKRMTAATQRSLKNLSCFVCIKMYCTILLLRSSTLISRGDAAGIRFSKDTTCREC